MPQNVQTKKTGSSAGLFRLGIFCFYAQLLLSDRKEISEIIKFFAILSDYFATDAISTTK